MSSPERKGSRRQNTKHIALGLRFDKVSHGLLRDDVPSNFIAYLLYYYFVVSALQRIVEVVFTFIDAPAPWCLFLSTSFRGIEWFVSLDFS